MDPKADHGVFFFDLRSTAQFALAPGVLLGTVLPNLFDTNRKSLVPAKWLVNRFGPVPFIVQNAILRVMWPFRKKTKQPKVVFNREHIGRELIRTAKRALSENEMEWVSQSLHSRKEFVDFSVPQLFAISKCPCGTCRTVGLEPLELPNWRAESGHLGGITIQTKDHGPIDILLHAKQRLASGNGSHLVPLSKAISDLMGGSQPDN